MVKDRPLVYIIVLNFNGWKDTIECLESIFRNNYPAYRVIVCDNDSHDSSLERIKAWADGRLNVLTPESGPLRHLSFPPVQKPIPYMEYDRIKLENEGKISDTFPHLLLIQTGSNLGFAGGNNVGIKYAINQGAEYVLLLNNDTVVCNNFLAPLVEVANISLETGVVGGKIMHYYQPDRIWYAGGKINYFTGRGVQFHMGETDKEMGFIPNRVTFVTGCMMLIKRAVFEKVGLMSEEYFLYCEDVDYCHNVLKAGLGIQYTPQSVIYHKESSTTKKDYNAFDYYYYRGKFIFMRKTLPAFFFYPWLIAYSSLFLLNSFVKTKNLRCTSTLYKAFLDSKIQW